MPAQTITTTHLRQRILGILSRKPWLTSKQVYDELEIPIKIPFVTRELDLMVYDKVLTRRKQYHALQYAMPDALVVKPWQVGQVLVHDEYGEGQILGFVNSIEGRFIRLCYINERRKRVIQVCDQENFTFEGWRPKTD